MYVYITAQIHTYAHIYIHAYIHTYIHMYMDLTEKSRLVFIYLRVISHRNKVIILKKYVE